MAEQGNGRLDQPMKGTWANPEKAVCKDCMHRDRTSVEVGGRIVNAGVTKMHCEMFQPPPVSNGKPLGILRGTMTCPFYSKE